VKILFLSHCLPYPPSKGDKVRAYHELRLLSRRHEVHLFALAKRAEEVGQEKHLRSMCAEVDVFPIDRRRARLQTALALLGSKPLSMAYFWNSSLAAGLQKRTQSVEFDLVLAYSSSMAPYAAGLKGVPRVLDMVDVDSAKWTEYARFHRFPRSLLYGLEAKRLKNYEKQVGATFERIVVSTKRELETLSRYGVDAQVHVMRNGVSVDNGDLVPIPKSSSPVLVFSGQMDYFPNVDAVTHFASGIVPRLRARYPDLEFLIVGRAPTPKVMRLRRIPGIIVTGEVPDVRPLLKRSWIFVAPLRIARGIQNKVLEAMSVGLPVVCSSAVWAGLQDSGISESRDILVGRDEREFEEAAGRLLEDEAERERLGANAAARVAESYSWESNIQELDKVLERLISSELDYSSSNLSADSLEEVSLGSA